MPQKAEDKPQNDTPDAVTIKATSAASRCSVSAMAAARLLAMAPSRASPASTVTKAPGKAVNSDTMVPSVFYGQLPSMVRRLRQNRNLEILLHELKTREQVDALKVGKIDIGFGRIRIEDPDVEQELLFDEPIIAAVPAGHQLTHEPPSMKALSEWPMIAFPSGPGPNFADIPQGLFHRRGLRGNVIQQVNDLQTALSLVASDMGFTLVPEQVRRLGREGVDYMPLADDNISTPVIASRRKGESPNAAMRLANTILAELVENRLTGRYP